MSRVHADIEALKALRDALPLFVERQRDGMEQAKREIEHTLSLLNQVEWHWRMEILSSTQSLVTGVPEILEVFDKKTDYLRQASYYLDDLTSQSQYSRAEDMRGIVEALTGFVPILSQLQEAYHLYEAIEKLGEIQSLRQKVNEEIEWYDGQAEQFDQHLGMEMPRAHLFLDERITALEAFYAAQIPNNPS